MNAQTKELLDSLGRARWFSAVGRPLTDDVAAVSSWDEATSCCASDEWSNYTLEQRNELTMYLHRHANERYQAWNDVTRDVRSVVQPLVENQARKAVSPHVAAAVASSAEWDVLAACMELEYSDIRPPAFFCGLMAWYLSGRFPCGWGERDAEGKLRLYGPVDESDYDASEPDFGKLVVSEMARVFQPAVRRPSVGKLLVY